MSSTIQHIYISLKWTHKTDAFFTLWKSDRKGYTYYLSDAGIYSVSANSEPEDTLSLWMIHIEPLLIKVKYEGKERTVLPNTRTVRSLLGLKMADLKKKYPSDCPRNLEIPLIKIK